MAIILQIADSVGRYRYSFFVQLFFVQLFTKSNEMVTWGQIFLIELCDNGLIRAVGKVLPTHIVKYHQKDFFLFIHMNEMRQQKTYFESCSCHFHGLCCTPSLNVFLLLLLLNLVASDHIMPTTLLFGNF